MGVVLVGDVEIENSVEVDVETDGPIEVLEAVLVDSVDEVSVKMSVLEAVNIGVEL